DDVVGGDHQGHIGAGEVRVGLVHVLHQLVGHVGLGEQYVHMTGHPAGNRVDGVADVDAAAGEHHGQLVHGVLGLGGGQAVAGHDDDPAGGGELDSRVRDA